MKNLIALGTLGLALAVVGCSGRNQQDTTPQADQGPTEPQEPGDYLGRMTFRLERAGIDRASIACNSDRRFAPTLRDDAGTFASDAEALFTPYVSRRILREREMIHDQVTGVAMNWFIRTLLIHGNLNNLGAVVLSRIEWSDEDGASHPLVVFHSGTTPDARAEGSCVRSLILTGHVGHVINLYDGDVPLRDLIEAEQAIAEELGAEYIDTSRVDLGYGGWRDIASDGEADAEQVRGATEAVTRLINEQIIRPGGSPPRGNVYFHCAGGMHRSPLVMGILRRCINEEPAEQVEEAMRYHAGYVDSDHPGGWEPPLAEFVRSYDCSLLQPDGPPPEQAAPAGDAAPGDQDGGVDATL
jgi:hypothetical protein